MENYNMKTIKGKFDVKATPLELDTTIQKLGGIKMLFEKQFFGLLEAKSNVSMMGVMNKELGSGGYVALEFIEGTVENLSGTFGMQHSSSMDRGTSLQSISIIPDSGTGELIGISGKMTIDIVEGQHYYNFEYSLKN
jgi:hypothetical protein